METYHFKHFRRPFLRQTAGKLIAEHFINASTQSEAVAYVEENYLGNFRILSDFASLEDTREKLVWTKIPSDECKNNCDVTAT